MIGLIRLCCMLCAPFKSLAKKPKVPDIASGQDEQYFFCFMIRHTLDRGFCVCIVFRLCDLIALFTELLRLSDQSSLNSLKS